MGGKENAAIPASYQTAAQMRLGPQRRSQKNVIFLHQNGNAGLPVPIRPPLEMPLNADG